MKLVSMLMKENASFYRSECQVQVLNFSGAKFCKFSTEAEAINFVNEHGKCNLENRTQLTYVKKSGENISVQHQIPSPKMSNKDVTQSPPGTAGVTFVSSPKLKGTALKQRLSVIEKKFEDSVNDLRREIGAMKERIETFNTKVNILSSSQASDKAEMTEEYETLQECLSQLAKHYTNSIVELKADISNLKALLGKEEGQNKTSSEKEACAGSSSLSFKRNLNAILEAAGPSTGTERFVKQHNTSMYNKGNIIQVYFPLIDIMYLLY